MAVEVRPKDALAFLRAFAPAGPWKLSAIWPGNPRVPTATFVPDTEPSAAAWIQQHNNAGANIYFETGLSDPAKANKKSLTADVTGSRSVSLDIDCGADRAKEVVDTLLKQTRGQHIPVPNLIVESGNGVWAHWLLDKPADPEEVRAIIKGLIAVFLPLGADKSCHNPDRIARLPGTTNTKNNTRAIWMPCAPKPYTIKQFSRFAEALGPTSVKAATGTAGPPLGVVPVADLSDLGLDPEDPGWLGAVLVTGYPKEQIEAGVVPGDRPAKGCGFDRSDVVFSAACELVRRGVAPGKIAGALLNPEWGISAHVFDNKPSESYALKQVRSAIERVEQAAEEKLLSATPPTDPRGALDWMNARHFVLEVDGKECVVASRLPSDIAPGKVELKVQSFTALRQRYSNKRVEVRDADGNVKLLPLGDFWLGCSGRRQFLRVMFRPGGAPVEEGCYNLWQGFGIEPDPGDWPLMKAHIGEVLADGDPVAEEYILRWAAYAVQHLSGPQGVVLAFRGGKGSGKGTFARVLTEMFGQHGLHIASSDLLTGRFTGHLEDCCLLFADEALHPGDREAEARLKGLVTEPVLTLEAKGRDARPVRNHLKIVMASNEDWIAPASWDERRYAVFDVSPKRIGDKRYFAALNRELEEGGKAAMLFDLLAMDLGDWRPGDAIPETGALRSQKDLSLPPEEAWLLDVLTRGEIPGEWPDNFAPYTRPSKYRLGSGGLFEDMQRYDRALASCSPQALGRFLGKWLDRYTTGTARGWRFPPLEEMRAKWERKHGPREWPEGVVEWPVEAWDRMEEAARDLPF